MTMNWKPNGLFAEERLTAAWRIALLGIILIGGGGVSPSDAVASDSWALGFLNAYGRLDALMSLPTLIPIAVGVLGLLIWALPKKFWCVAAVLVVVAWAGGVWAQSDPLSAAKLKLQEEILKNQIQEEVGNMELRRKAKEQLAKQEEEARFMMLEREATRLAPRCTPRFSLLGPHADKGWASLSSHANVHTTWRNQDKRDITGRLVYLKPWCGPLMQALITDPDKRVGGIEQLYLFYRLDLGVHRQHDNKLPFERVRSEHDFIEYPARMSQAGKIHEVTFRSYHGYGQLVLMDQIEMRQEPFSVYFPIDFLGPDVHETWPGGAKLIKIDVGSRYATYNFVHPKRVSEGTIHRL